MKKILLFFILINSTVGVAATFKDYDYKVWAWGDSSQIQVIDDEQNASILLFFKYKEKKSGLSIVEFQTLGPEDHLFKSISSLQDIKAFIEKIELGQGELNVALFGERSVDPLGPQPTQELDAYSEIEALSKPKKSLPEAIFVDISWAEMRGIIKSDLSQKEIDFYLFKKTVLTMLNIRRSSAPSLYNLDNKKTCANLL